MTTKHSEGVRGESLLRTFVGLTVGNIRNVSKVSSWPGKVHVQKFHERAVAVIMGDFHTD